MSGSAFTQVSDNRVAFAEMMNMSNADTSRSILNPSISVTKVHTLKHHPQRAQRRMYEWVVCGKKTLSLTEKSNHRGRIP